jgi:hypothetical protein
VHSAIPMARDPRARVVRRFRRRYYACAANLEWTTRALTPAEFRYVASEASNTRQRLLSCHGSSSRRQFLRQHNANPRRGTHHGLKGYPRDGRCWIGAKSPRQYGSQCFGES